MAMKQLAQRLQPLQLYLMLVLTVCLFLLMLTIAHVTHSLTLLLDSYQSICNVIVLCGSIISTKYGSSSSSDRDPSTATNSQEELKSLASLPHHQQMCCASRPGPERQLRNTFGWARVDVIVMLIACVFLSSLLFGLVVEALQTLIHISHHDEMHAPITVLVVGILSMLVNLLAYLLIGGYTFHRGSFLNNLRPEAGALQEAGQCQPDSKEQLPAVKPKHEKRQGLIGLFRDCAGCLVVIVCAIVVFSTESEVAKYVDPLLSIFSAILVLILSYPFMKESCLILLQTIPDHINIGSLCDQLIKAFPNIVNVHELHVWRLTVDKTYCTAHIIFLNPKEYCRITDDISRFFLGQGITHVTIQPEFYKDVNKKELLTSNVDCLVQCTEDLCMERHCCASRTPSLESVHVDSHKHKGSTKAKSKCSSHSPNSSTSKAEVEEKCKQHTRGEVPKKDEEANGYNTENAGKLKTNITETAKTQILVNDKDNSDGVVDLEKNTETELNKKEDIETETKLQEGMHRERSDV